MIPAIDLKEGKVVRLLKGEFGKAKVYSSSPEDMAKDWRMDRSLRRLEALLLVADRDHMYLLSGNGDVIEPAEPVLAIGSGGDYARASALAIFLTISGLALILGPPTF